ncbi:YdeI/OmpD-associated family protein [Microvirga thermotolerans]|uniref:Uncharacterized protein n=1 Tax=Microvirga thermotolerans TaxID=2651334 RepID=A0A5P9JZ89_9HYPH|nr:YdeI/OmpD-associated family protein [Microvirga thermotolerans]QFU17569.1 hypothetical protein GDR74_15860 [Microvirga thermotolerans]
MNDLPTDIRDALDRALASLAPSRRHEYLSRIEEAGKPEMRRKRSGGTMERPTAPRGA